MINWSFFMVGAILALSILGLAVSFTIPGTDLRTKRYFTDFFTVLTILIILVIIDSILYEKPSMVTVERMVWAAESVCLSLPIIMFTAYLLLSCGEDVLNSRLFQAELALLCLYLLMIVAAQFTSLVYYVSSDSQFNRGPLYPLIVMPLIAATALNLAAVLRRRKRLQETYFIAFLIHIISLSISFIIYTFILNAMIIEIGVTLSALAMFAIILYYQLDEYLKQQRELANQKANIMVLQMRPHFIYNTMTSIYYLCEQDAKKAQQVILDFTNYLRKNFTAIASDHTIAFKDELEHTKAYLAVEQAQFEDNLFVSYNIDHTDFSLPPLTLQPLVENAVKHGMDLDRGPLRITVSTVRTPSGSEIQVEDDGQGFSDTAADTPHVALENIRSRLELMCGGTLSIAAGKDGGTIVKVFIPDQKK